jgi:putative membrane protein
MLAADRARVKSQRIEGDVMRKVVWMVALALPVLALASEKSADESFYKEAAEDGLTEIEQGKIAQQKGQSQDVKEFAQMMVHDHSVANEKLKSIASGKGINLPNSPSVGQTAAIGKLNLLSGDSLDKSYIKGMVKDHQEDIAAFEKEAANGRDPDARAFAATTLLTLRMHLSQIQSVAAAHHIASK